MLLSAIGGLKLSRAAKPGDMLRKLRMCDATEFVCRLAGRFAIIGAERDECRTLRAGRKRQERDFAALVYQRCPLADVKSVGILDLAFARLERKAHDRLLHRAPERAVSWINRGKDDFLRPVALESVAIEANLQPFAPSLTPGPCTTNQSIDVSGGFIETALPAEGSGRATSMMPPLWESPISG